MNRAARNRGAVLRFRQLEIRAGQETVFRILPNAIIASCIAMVQNAGSSK
ncbi:hypothetical protein [Chachezhania antarctica]|nr:hypothetical protein [Chachezhania antarctica]|tara:strand:+ start:3769 stop:3918 length:150 start_codon:yes stop_codon:yes gene_type:complete